MLRLSYLSRVVVLRAHSVLHPIPAQPSSAQRRPDSYLRMADEAATTSIKRRLSTDYASSAHLLGGSVLPARVGPRNRCTCIHGSASAAFLSNLSEKMGSHCPFMRGAKAPKTQATLSGYSDGCLVLKTRFHRHFLFRI